jgi:hypothetical protein
MRLANQACFSFVSVLEARVEGSSATCGIEVGVLEFYLLLCSEVKDILGMVWLI